MRPKAVVRGGGDLATAAGRRLHVCGFDVIHLEAPRPTVIRRKVSFASAVYCGTITVEGLTARLAGDTGEAGKIVAGGEVAVLVDPGATSVPLLRPTVVVDAIMAKGRWQAENPTRMGWAECVVALGPGFEAGVDVHYVVETCRGHFLGKVYTEGEALPFTGVPGSVLGVSLERILRAPDEGVFDPLKDIGDLVTEGETVARVSGKPIRTAVSGVLRGLLHGGLDVMKGQKVGDVDPRCAREHCFTISDKANAVAGGVLEAVFRGCAHRWVREGSVGDRG